MAKVTDIKNTKIRVENEEHSNDIQKIAGKFGYKWRGDDCFEANQYKEIFFYNGEFHDKPQNEIDLDVSGQLDRLLEGNKAKEKLSKLGYIFHQGEWLYKEEIEKQRQQGLLDRVSNLLHENGFGNDQLILKCLLSHGLLDLSRVEDSERDL